MADSRFFKNSGALSLEAIVLFTGATATPAGGGKADPKRTFSDIAPLESAGAEDVSFLDNVKYLGAFAASKAGACFVRPKFAARAPKGMLLLVTEEPYYCYALTARQFYPDSPVKEGIAATAIVAKSAHIGHGVRVDAGAVIGEHVRLGDHTRIGANTVIDDGVEIGNHCRIGACCTISHALLGNRIMLHRGVHIGQDGFGFAPGGKGILKVPQLGRVLIGDDVEIGSGTCIDRGAGPDTMIGDGCKIDNLVQIGHNVQIGRYVMMAAQCGIAGSTQVGDGVQLGGQVGITGHVRIGKGAKVAAQSGVIADIPDGLTYGGSPAVPVKDWHRQTVALANSIKKKHANES
jgi:UDP-3-O-[3-hydroxymyristoyl] glucosamine N-acyltransferase